MDTIFPIKVHFFTLYEESRNTEKPISYPEECNYMKIIELEEENHTI
jgi:hypothetical protein